MRIQTPERSPGARSSGAFPNVWAYPRATKARRASLHHRRDHRRARRRHVSGNDALLESLKPMLVEQGWLEAGPVDEQAARAENDLEAEGPDASPERMDIVSPLRDWTVTERISLLRTLYGRQCLLNRMMQARRSASRKPS